MSQKILYHFLLGIFSIALLYYFFLIYKKSNHNNIDHKPKIICSTTIIADAIRHIAGDSVELITLMGPGVDPHTYKPIETDIFNIAQADIIFYHGLHLEARMSDLFGTMKTYKKTIAVSDTIAKEMLIYDSKFAQYADPHVWFDPELWMIVVQNITNHLQRLNPEHADAYQIHAKQYLQNIAQIHEQNKKIIASIPPEQRILITGHDAFSYFARAYQFQVFSLQGINTASQAGAKDVSNIVSIIVNHHVKTIFPENSLPLRNMQSLMQAACLQGQTVNIGSELFSDSLGSADTAQATYTGMIHSNVCNIANGLM